MISEWGVTPLSATGWFKNTRWFILDKKFPSSAAGKKEQKNIIKKTKDEAVTHEIVKFILSVIFLHYLLSVAAAAGPPPPLSPPCPSLCTLPP